MGKWLCLLCLSEGLSSWKQLFQLIQFLFFTSRKLLFSMDFWREASFDPFDSIARFASRYQEFTHFLPIISLSPPLPKTWLLFLPLPKSWLLFLPLPKTWLLLLPLPKTWFLLPLSLRLRYYCLGFCRPIAYYFSSLEKKFTRKARASLRKTRWQQGLQLSLSA